MLIFRSSRFIAFILILIIFTIMVFTTHYTPIDIAGAISIIGGMYIIPRTLRGSTNALKP
jgi:hypothetical protein